MNRLAECSLRLTTNQGEAPPRIPELADSSCHSDPAITKYEITLIYRRYRPKTLLSCLIVVTLCEVSVTSRRKAGDNLVAVVLQCGRPEKRRPTRLVMRQTACGARRRAEVCHFAGFRCFLYDLKKGRLRALSPTLVSAKGANDYDRFGTAPLGHVLNDADARGGWASSPL